MNLVYLTYNSEADVADGLPLMAGSSGCDLDIIAVDNASPDGSVAELRKLGLDPVVMDENVGFTAGINRALQDCNDEWAVIANPDVRPTVNGWAEQLVDVPDDVGIVGARLVQGPLVIHGGGRVSMTPSLICWMSPYPVPGGEVWCNEVVGSTRFMMLDGGITAHSEMRSVPWVTFALVAVRMEMFHEIGPLDESLWLYSSDVEYCTRALLNDWSVWYNPISFRHESGSSLRKAHSSVVQRGRADIQEWCSREPDILQQLREIGRHGFYFG